MAGPPAFSWGSGGSTMRRSRPLLLPREAASCWGTEQESGGGTGPDRVALDWAPAQGRVFPEGVYPSLPRTQGQHGGKRGHRFERWAGLDWNLTVGVMRAGPPAAHVPVHSQHRLPPGHAGSTPRHGESQDVPAAPGSELCSAAGSTERPEPPLAHRHVRAGRPRGRSTSCAASCQHAPDTPRAPGAHRDAGTAPGLHTPV